MIVCPKKKGNNIVTKHNFGLSNVEISSSNANKLKENSIIKAQETSIIIDRAKKK